MNNSQSNNGFTLISDLEKIQRKVLELFGDSSHEEGLLFTRTNTLHQFAILVSVFHQFNTLEVLDSNNGIGAIFREELDIAQYRTQDYKHKAIRTIRKNLKKLESYHDDIIDLIENVERLFGLMSRFTDNIQYTYYRQTVQSIHFYLQEIKVRIIEPALKIINSEIEATYKLLDLIENRQNSKYEISNEDIARMCEVMSWGLESSPGWKSIQSDTNELTSDLAQKLGNLKAFNTTYYTQ